MDETDTATEIIILKSTTNVKSRQSLLIGYILLNTVKPLQTVQSDYQACAVIIYM